MRWQHATLLCSGMLLSGCSPSLETLHVMDGFSYQRLLEERLVVLPTIPENSLLGEAAFRGTYGNQGVTAEELETMTGQLLAAIAEHRAGLSVVHSDLGIENGHLPEESAALRAFQMEGALTPDQARILGRALRSRYFVLARVDYFHKTWTSGEDQTDLYHHSGTLRGRVVVFDAELGLPAWEGIHETSRVDTYEEDRDQDRSVLGFVAGVLAGLVHAVFLSDSDVESSASHYPPAPPPEELSEEFFELVVRNWPA